MLLICLYLNYGYILKESMLKLLFIAVIFLSHLLFGQHIPPQTPPIHVTINNSNKQEQHTPGHFGACASLFTTSLKECLHARNIKKRKKIFLKLSHAQQKSYITHLSLAEYEAFVEQYTQPEWEQLLQSHPVEHTSWPATVQEQKAKIQEIRHATQTKEDFDIADICLMLCGIPPVFTMAFGAYAAVTGGSTPLHANSTKDLEKYFKEKFKHKEKE